MNTKLFLPLLVLFATTATAAPNFTPSAEDLLALLKSIPQQSPIPDLQDTSATTLAAGISGTSMLAWAESSADNQNIPETTYTLYRQFRENGVRKGYEQPYYEKRTLLTQEVLRWYLGGHDDRIWRINDLLWSICEETTWVLPAHEKDPDFIDLFAAETGADLAHILALMGDALPKEVQARVRDEVKKRIIDPYLKVGPEYGWGRGRNNWTGVCAGSVGQVILLMEPDLERQARGLSVVLQQLDNFIQNAFEEDGGCLEGIGYWNYGLLHYVAFAEMMRARTQGKIDILSHPKIKAIAQYPLAAWLGGSTYASFSDSHETASVVPYLGATLARRADAPGLLALVSPSQRWTLGSLLRDLSAWNGEAAAPAAVKDCFLPISGIARFSCDSRGHKITVAAKAGFNNEPHNHNDVGSFIVAVDADVFLCDPGGGLYTREYFSPARYKNIFANSYGHSVPRIGGNLQSTGDKFRGEMKKLSGKKSGVKIEFGAAYDVAELARAERVIEAASDGLRLSDDFRFKNNPMEVEEAFMTWKKVQVSGNTAKIVGDKRTLEIVADNGTFSAEKLEQACKENQKDGMLTRINVTYPAMNRIHAGFIIRVLD